VQWHFNQDYEGDTGPEQLQTAVAEVLRTRA